MKLVWNTLADGFELKWQQTQRDGMPGQEATTLGGVKLMGDYAYPWAFNKAGSTVFLPVLFASKTEQAKESVLNYLTQVKIIDPQPTNLPENETAL